MSDAKIDDKLHLKVLKTFKSKNSKDFLICIVPYLDDLGILESHNQQLTGSLLYV